MEQLFHREKLREGVYFSGIRDAKFRHNSISVNIITLPERATASQNALLPALLSRSCASCPDATRLERRLCDLYGAELSGDISRCGEAQVLSLSAAGIDDRYALGGESVSAGLAELIGDVTLAPDIYRGAFRRSAFEVERRDLAETIAAEINDKRGYAVRRCRELMCAGTRLAISKYGDPDTLAAATPKQTYGRYLELLRGARIEIVATGCGDPGRARERFAGLFADMPREYSDFDLAPALPEHSGLREETQRMAVSQAKLVMGLRAGDISTAEKRSALRVMTLLLGSTPFSRLFRNVREKRSICYYCSASADAVSGIMTIDSGVDESRAAEAREAIMGEIAALAREPAPEKELAETKLYASDILRSTADSLGRMEGWYLSGILRGDIITPEEQAARLNAVTAEQVREAAAALRLDTVYLLAGNGEAPYED